MPTTGFPDWQVTQSLITELGVLNTSLQQLLTQLQAGVPGITNPVLLANSGSHKSILAAGTDVYGPYNTTGTSYSLSLALGNHAGSTVGVWAVTIYVYDSIGNLVDFLYYDLPGDQDFQGADYVLLGPINGTSIEVWVNNPDTVTEQYTMTLTASNIPLTRHTIETTFLSVSHNFTLAPNAQPGELVLGRWSSSIAAGATLTYLLPPISGNVAVSVKAANAAANMLAGLYGLTGIDAFAGVSGVPLWQGQMSSVVPVTAIVPVPRCATLLSVKNSEGVADTLTAAVTTQPA